MAPVTTTEFLTNSIVSETASISSGPRPIESIDSVGEIETRLNNLNVRLAGDEDDAQEVRNELQNSNSSYRALAEDIFRLLGDKRLPEPLDLNVIHSRYEKSLLLPSMNSKTEALENAFVRVWNLNPNRTKAQSLEDIVKVE